MRSRRRSRMRRERLSGGGLRVPARPQALFAQGVACPMRFDLMYTGDRQQRGPRAMSALGEVVLKFEGESFLGEEAARAGLILLGSFLLSFLFIRTSARLMRSPKVTWWPGSIETEGGLHVHHLVFGIVLMLLVGFVLALQPASPWAEIMAGAFGIGAGLTLDEYALWLHLEDVYWSEQGRRSVDAVVVAALIGGLLLMGFIPFSTDDGIFTILATIAIGLGIAIVAVLKGKYL